METKEVHIAIRKIKILFYNQHAIEQGQFVPDPKFYIVNLNFAFTPELEKDFFHVIVNVEIKYKDEQRPTFKVMDTSVQITYSIVDLKSIVIVNVPEHFEMTDLIMIPLVTESLATVRGILYAKNLGTFAGGTTIPMLDTNEFLSHYKAAAQISLEKIQKKATQKSNKIQKKQSILQTKNK